MNTRDLGRAQLAALDEVAQPLGGRQLARGMLRFERPLQLILGAGLLAVGAWDLWLNLPQVLG